MRVIEGYERIVWPLGAALLASGSLSLVYFAIVSWAESPQHAVQLFWDDRWIVIPIVAGFGIQAALYTILRKRLYLPAASAGRSGPMLGAGGATSAVAMVACCAHHVTDVLPILGLTLAATLLAQHRTAFMLVGLATTLAGIGVMVRILLRERRRARASALAAMMEAT